MHEGGVRIEILDDGAYRYVKRNGEAYENKPAKSSGDASRVDQFGSCEPAQWTGGPCDYGQGVDALLAEVGIREYVPGGTSRDRTQRM